MCWDDSRALSAGIMHDQHEENLKSPCVSPHTQPATNRRPHASPQDEIFEVQTGFPVQSFGLLFHLSRKREMHRKAAGVNTRAWAPPLPERNLEAASGIEPLYRDLQSLA